jgi:hypothetical protein
LIDRLGITNYWPQRRNMLGFYAGSARRRSLRSRGVRVCTCASAVRILQTHHLFEAHHLTLRVMCSPTKDRIIYSVVGTFKHRFCRLFTLERRINRDGGDLWGGRGSKGLGALDGELAASLSSFQQGILPYLCCSITKLSSSQ